MLKKKEDGEFIPLYAVDKFKWIFFHYFYIGGVNRRVKF